MDFTLPNDLYVGYLYFLSIYHVLPFGSSEIHGCVYVFLFKVVCFQLYILIHVFISIKLIGHRCMAHTPNIYELLNFQKIKGPTSLI